MVASGSARRSRRPRLRIEVTQLLQRFPRAVTSKSRSSDGTGLDEAGHECRQRLVPELAILDEATQIAAPAPPTMTPGSHPVIETKPIGVLPHRRRATNAGKPFVEHQGSERVVNESRQRAWRLRVVGMRQHAAVKATEVARGRARSSRCWPSAAGRPPVAPLFGNLARTRERERICSSPQTTAHRAVRETRLPRQVVGSRIQPHDEIPRRDACRAASRVRGNRRSCRSDRRWSSASGCPPRRARDEQRMQRHCRRPAPDSSGRRRK